MPSLRVAENATTRTRPDWIGNAAAIARVIPCSASRCRDGASLSIFVARTSTGRPLGRNPVEQLDVEFREAMARIDDQHETDQRLARRHVAAEEILPVVLELERHRRVSVAGEIGEQRTGSQAEEIDLLRAPRRLARECEPRTVREHVDRRRLAGVRASCERDFRRSGRRQLGIVRDGEGEFGLLQGMLHGTVCGRGFRARLRLWPGRRFRYNTMFLPH